MTAAGDSVSVWDMDEGERRVAFAARERKGMLALIPETGTLPPSDPQTPMVAEALRQLHAALLADGLDEHAKRVQAIIWLATNKNAMRVLREVSRKHNVDSKTIRSESRSRNVVFARYELCHRLFHELDYGVTRIGDFIGRDHATVINALRRYEEEIAK